MTRYAERKIDAAIGMAGVVNDAIGNNFTVRDNDFFIIYSKQRRRKNMYRLHHPWYRTNLHEITRPEWTQSHQQYASGKIWQRALQRQANGQTRRANNRDDGRSFNPYST